MADVAMGQALNTVTCPVCYHSSRNFDPFNLLSIPIPTVADVVYQCTVFRRATAKNCPYVLAKVRKGDKRQTRFDYQSNATTPGGGPPNDLFSVEQYFVALSRLADSGDLRLQIQNLSGIRANQLRLCRVEEVPFSDDAKGSHTLQPHRKVTPLADKDVPAGQPKKREPNEENGETPVTEIVAFEMTLNARVIEWNNGDNNDDEDDDDVNGADCSKSPKMAARLKRYLDVYGDEQECRLVDTESLTIAKAVSRSLWPRSSEELKLGLRVDAMDHRGNWFPGSVIEIIDNKGTATEVETGTSSASNRRVRVHFDNFSSKWDEMYAIDHFTQGRVMPLYSHSIPKRKPTEFLVHHRHTDRQTGQLVVFGHSFYIQCQGEWSNARAGAHILAQVCRFMDYRTSSTVGADNGTNEELENKAVRLYEKTHAAISDLIDLLVDCDREYVKLALGVSQHNNAEERSRPFRNPSFDASLLSIGLVKKVTGLLQRLPFELRICTVDGVHSDKPNTSVEEALFPFSLVRTIGNFMNIRHAVFLQWREPTVVDKKTPTSTASYRSFLNSPVMYVDPVVHTHEASAPSLNYDPTRGSKMKNKANVTSATESGGRGGIDLKYCLKEFCKVQKLSISDSWKCPMCKVHREGGQNMNLWRLPDLLTFHIKRFNMSARWHEKITTKVNFPLTGLDMRDFCHPDSPVLNDDVSATTVYDLIGVMNHYGSMTGGHYVATCKATACSKYGREEVGYNFNGVGASTCFESLLESSNVVNTGSDINHISGAWSRLGGGRSNKNVDTANQNKALASMASRSAAESAEPTWLQFDDEVVEPIPPDAVCSEMAYVLFYRRRNLSSSNIAKYSTLE
jgi:Ubiquitin carboxyl-terminal hydrolase